MDSTINLPPEIWLNIIEYAYPISRGWHRNLMDLCRTSKMHYNLTAYLFKKYIYYPYFNTGLDNYYLSIEDVIKFITKDLPVIEPGFLQDTKVSPRDIIIHLVFKNCITNESFFDKKYSDNRCLVANIYSCKNLNDYETKLKYPFFIIPTSDKTGVYLMGKNRDWYYIIFSDSNDKIPYTIPYYDQVSYLPDSSRFLEIIQYVLDHVNIIPNTIKELKDNAFAYLLTRNFTRCSLTAKEQKKIIENIFRK